MTSRQSAWLVTALVTAATTAGVYVAFRPVNAGQPIMLATLGAIYGVGAIATGVWLHRRGELRQRLAPHRGDVTFGAMVAVGMYLLGMGLHVLLASRSAPQLVWIMRIYLQIGDPSQTSSMLIGPIILLIAGAEEIVWRGGVMARLEEAHGKRAALLVTTGLYAAAHLPTVYLLRDPHVGLNPLVALAALGCGLVWGALAMSLGRISLSVCAHALFTWSLVEFPLLNM